jgi:hypothetical protein
LSQITYLIHGINQPIGSKEEWMFIHWLKEAEQAGYVEPNWVFQPPEIILSEPQYVTQVIKKQLKTKLKIIEKRKEIIKGCSYNPDFIFKVTSKFTDQFPNIFWKPDKQGYTWVDTKGGFAGAHNNSAISFPVKQKWTYQKTDIYVQKIVPGKFFKTTWVPERCCLTYKTLKPCKTFEKGYKTLKELNSNIGE